MPPLRAVWHALTQIVIVGLGASVGREVAPREMAAALAAAAADRLGLCAQDRRIIVACGAGAGLAAVYSIPLSGAIYTLEVLLVSRSARAVAPALVSSSIAVLLSTGFTRPAFFYSLPPPHPFPVSHSVWGARRSAPGGGRVGVSPGGRLPRFGSPTRLAPPRRHAALLHSRRPRLDPGALGARKRAGQRPNPVRRRLGRRSRRRPRRACPRCQDRHNPRDDSLRRLGRRPDSRGCLGGGSRGRHRTALGRRMAGITGCGLRVPGRGSLPRRIHEGPLHRPHPGHRVHRRGRHDPRARGSRGRWRHRSRQLACPQALPGKSHRELSTWIPAVHGRIRAVRRPGGPASFDRCCFPLVTIISARAPVPGPRSGPLRPPGPPPGAAASRAPRPRRPRASSAS